MHLSENILNRKNHTPFMEIEINTPLKTVLFQTEFFKPFENINTFVLTIINTKKDKIKDLVFKEVEITKKENKYTLESKNNFEFLALFDLVSFMNPKCTSLYEVFQKYDGEIYAFNEKDFLMSKTESSEGKIENVIYAMDLIKTKDYIGYVLTAYHE